MKQSRTVKVLALSTGRATTAIVAIVSSMAASRLLTIHDYATMKQTMLAYSFAAPVLTLSLPQAIYYFLPGEKKRPRGIIIDNLSLLVIMGAVFSLFLALGGNKLFAMRFSNPDLEHTLRWMIPYPLFTLPAGILGAVMVVQGRVTALSIYNILSRLLLSIAIIVGCIVTHSYSGPLLAQIIFPVITLPLVLWMVFSSVPGKIQGPNWPSMKSMLKYSIPLGLAFMLGSISLQLDKMVVSSLCTPEEFAIYVNGAMEIPLIGILTGSISTVILADMARYCKEQNYQRSLILFRKAALYSSIILFPTMCFLLIYAEDFIVTIYSSKYIGSTIPFQIYLLILPIRIVYFGSALMAIGQTKIILFRTIGDLLINLIISIILVQIIGYLGAAIATIAMLYLWSTPFNFYYIARGYGCKWYEILPLYSLLSVLLISLAASMLTYLVNLLLNLNFNYIIHLILSAILFLFFYSTIVYFLIPEARAFVNNIIKPKLNFTT